MRLVYIVNPISGTGGGSPRRRERVEAFVRAEGLDAEVLATTHAGHARELAARAVADGATRVVAVGGDGTMNEVASALVGTPCVFGLVPTGSGNGLARHLGLPVGLRAALRVTVRGRIRTIDTGSVNGLPFFNVMGAGMDAEIGRRFNTTRRRGFVAYASTALRTLFNYPLQQFRLAEPGGSTPLPAVLVAIANSTQYGNAAHIAPLARVDDGQLDLVAVTSRRPKDLFGVAARLFLGLVHHSPHVVTRRGGSFRLERPEPGWIHTDGEVHPADATLDVAVLPRSLRILVP